MSDRLKEIRERHTEFGTGCDLEIHCDACYLLAQLEERDDIWDQVMSQSIGLSYSYETETFRNQRAEVAENSLAERDSEIAKYRLALSLACEMHGCAASHCEPSDYKQDAEKLGAQLAEQDKEIKLLKIAEEATAKYLVAETERADKAERDKAERDALLERMANDYIDEACDLHIWALQVALDYRKLKEGR